ncbi:MAG: hypothetical protein M3M85_01060 [bacterium]|nr:hypothetical protein [bacterium]
MKNIKKWNVWRQIKIPIHKGSADFLEQIEEAEMHVESWATDYILAHPFEERLELFTFPVARVSAFDLGFPRKQLVTIGEIKAAGQSNGLKMLNAEKILALRLGYKDQKKEWMRVAVATMIDKDQSHLDLALVNDGSRIDIRTTWAFPGNFFQAEHEWFWEIK